MARRPGRACPGGRREPRMATGHMTNRDRPTLLLVEDDAATRGFLGDNLHADGYDDRRRPDGRRRPAPARHRLPRPRDRRRRAPRRARGLDLVAHVREADGVATRIDPGVPILVLIARDDELDRVRAFERGADDVLAKPLELPRAALPGRRAAAPQRPPRAAPAGCASATSRSTRASRSVHLRGDRAGPERQGVRAAAHARGRPDARLHQGSSCCARSGASGPSGRRGRSTRTPAGCAASSASAASASW